jgi:hypothetical protein
MSWLIHSFISLNEDRVTLMNIIKTCRIYEFQAIYTTSCKIIGSWPYVTNLKNKNTQFMSIK